MKDNKMPDATWAIGGGLLVGLGVGFIFLTQSALFFIASILIGLGGGLVISALLSKCKCKQ